jgi:hypothetical protein
MIEFHEWRGVAGNKERLQEFVLQADKNLVVPEHLQSMPRVAHIANQVADHLESKCGVITLGGNGYGYLFTVIPQILRSEGGQR